MSIRKQLFYSFIGSIIITTLFVFVLYKLMWFDGQQTILLTLCSFVSSMITLTLAIGFTIPTIKKLERLNQQTQDIAQGNYHVDSLDIRTPKELKELNHSFDVMVARIREQLELIQSEQDEKIRLIQNLAHDLKTPLASMRSYTEGLRDGVIRDEKAVTHAYDVLISQSERLANMFDDLTGLMTLSQSTRSISLIHIDQFLVPILDTYQHQLSREQRHLEVDLVPKLHPFYQDQGALERIITNLIDNALKFSPAGSTITIKIDQKDGDQLMMSVKDEGIGIAEADLPHIFERTYRVEHSRNLKTGGSGLGLYIAHTLAEQIGGQLTVESALNVGTTMTLTFPIQQNK
ncbi:sensor histidine kinase [Staphylococcus auricularis]|uniref:sensor histidine kinase n=1 Tax=Staphylococcus auricularis TaxID=29379 RepID=UPI00242A58B1|nr:HAMP domain-containing sensor histidine kinase [Staphylococcus auricularis]